MFLPSFASNRRFNKALFPRPFSAIFRNKSNLHEEFHGFENLECVWNRTILNIWNYRIDSFLLVGNIFQVQAFQLDRIRSLAIASSFFSMIHVDLPGPINPAFLNSSGNLCSKCCNCILKELQQVLEEPNASGMECISHITNKLKTHHLHQSLASFFLFLRSL